MPKREPTPPARRHPTRRGSQAPEPQTPGGIDDFDLSWHLPHLLRRAHFEAEACFNGIYGNAVTSRQLALLVTVAQTPSASQSTIAQLIGLDANTCSDLVRRAIDKGWLQRDRAPHDGRAWRLGLTASGRAVVEDSALPLADAYSDRVAARLTPAQRRQLTQLLHKMLGFHSQPPDDGEENMR